MIISLAKQDLLRLNKLTPAMRQQCASNFMDSSHQWQWVSCSHKVSYQWHSFIPAFAKEHMFCASRDGQRNWCLLIQRWFLCALGLCRKRRLKQGLLRSVKKIAGSHPFFRDDSKASIWKKSHTFFCILKLFTIIVA